MTDEQTERLQKLEVFFKEVAYLTVKHGVAYVTDNSGNTIDIASVSPKDLGNALAKVDENWWKTCFGFVDI